MQASISALENQISPVESEVNSKKSEISSFASKINALTEEISSLQCESLSLEKEKSRSNSDNVIKEIEETIIAAESDLQKLPKEKAELEAEIATIKENMNSYEWIPDSIDENFNDGCGNVDEIYEYIMANYYKSNEKVKAIKYHREQTGMGLKESKDIVDAMFDGTYVPVGTKIPSSSAANSGNSLDDYIRTHFNANTKVQAIKYYREQTGMGLKESKDAVDRLLGN